jgi:Zn-dependent peptidase ImmA (M78 family)
VARSDSIVGDLLEEAKITGPPVDVERLAGLRNASVVSDELDKGVSGALLRRTEGNVILVNRDHAHTRQRFTIAHELGHLLLHDGRPVIVDHVVRAHVNLRDERSSLATDREEIDANQFAANLLMPAPFVRELVAKMLTRRTGDSVIPGLAKAFDVSEQAMEYRLINLGLSGSAD